MSTNCVQAQSEKKKQKTSEDCVGEQIEFLILLTLYEDSDYQRDGVDRNNLSAALAENRKLWLNVGQQKDTKSLPESFAKRLDWCLTNLGKAGVLRKKAGSRKHVKGTYFDEGFRQRIDDLYNVLNFELEFDDYALLEDTDLLEKRIKEGTVQYRHSSFNELREKQLVMLTDEQIAKFVQLSVRFHISI